MSIRRSVKIPATVLSVGQFDRTEQWLGHLDVTREADGRVRIGQSTQAGFEALIVSLDDLREAVEVLGASDGD